MEMKEIYIAPEVEILCFQPVETLASFLTTTWNWGNGYIGEEDQENDGIEIPSNGDSEEAEDP